MEQSCTNRQLSMKRGLSLHPPVHSLRSPVQRPDDLPRINASSGMKQLKMMIFGGESTFSFQFNYQKLDNFMLCIIINAKPMGLI